MQFQLAQGILTPSRPAVGPPTTLRSGVRGTGYVTAHLSQVAMSGRYSKSVKRAGVPPTPESPLGFPVPIPWITEMQMCYFLIGPAKEHAPLLYPGHTRQVMSPGQVP